MALTKAQVQKNWRDRRNAQAKRAAEIEPILESIRAENEQLKDSLRELKRTNNRLLSALERVAVRVAG